ncbi:MAG: MaoC/PaaZ C-terminal domain-containing protein [Candidatus Thorarchaeota archaeon]
MSDEIVKLNRDFLGKEYSTGPQLVESESIRQYALATNEKNQRYLSGAPDAELVPPPLYPVVFLPPILSQLVDDSEEMDLNILRVVHAGHKMSWRDVIRPGDEIHTTAKIINMEQRGVNDILDLEIHCKREETVVVEMWYRLLVRGKKTARVDRPAGSTQIIEKGKVLAKKEIVVTDDQGIRYAEAAGDHNPIHISDEIAKSVGLPSAIVHGLCTMALASQVLVDELLNGDPSRLKNMEVRFSRPLLMDQKLTTEVYNAGIKDDGTHVVHFESRDAKDVPVLIRGVAEFIE